MFPNPGAVVAEGREFLRQEFGCGVRRSTCSGVGVRDVGL